MSDNIRRAFNEALAHGARFFSLRSETLQMFEANQLSQTAAAAVSNYAQVAQQAFNCEFFFSVMRTVRYFGKVHSPSASSSAV